MFCLKRRSGFGGGDGADQFRYDSTITGIDRIFDFTSGTDKIAFLSSGFGGSGPIALVQGAGSLSANSAAFTILHDTDTGKLYFDLNGNAAGGLFLFAQVNAGLTLTASDFVFV